MNNSNNRMEKSYVLLFTAKWTRQYTDLFFLILFSFTAKKNETNNYIYIYINMFKMKINVNKLSRNEKKIEWLQ